MSDHRGEQLCDYSVFPATLSLATYSVLVHLSTIWTARWLINKPFLTCLPTFFALKARLDDTTVWVKPLCLAFTKNHLLCENVLVCVFPFPRRRGFPGRTMFWTGSISLHTRCGSLLIELRWSQSEGHDSLPAQTTLGINSTCWAPSQPPADWF